MRQIYLDPVSYTHLRGILRQRPGGALLHVQVHAARQLLHGRRSPGEVHLGHAGVVFRIQPIGDLAQRVVLGARGRLGHAALEVLRGHVRHARDEVAPGIGQVSVVHLHHALHGDGAVVAELHVAHKVVAVGVHAEHAHEVGGHKAVTLRLRHLLALGEQKAVAEHRVRAVSYTHLI